MERRELKELIKRADIVLMNMDREMFPVTFNVIFDMQKVLLDSYKLGKLEVKS